MTLWSVVVIQLTTMRPLDRGTTAAGAAGRMVLVVMTGPYDRCFWRTRGRKGRGGDCAGAAGRRARTTLSSAGRRELGTGRDRVCGFDLQSGPGPAGHSGAVMQRGCVPGSGGAFPRVDGTVADIQERSRLGARPGAVRAMTRSRSGPGRWRKAARTRPRLPRAGVQVVTSATDQVDQVRDAFGEGTPAPDIQGCGGKVHGCHVPAASGKPYGVAAVSGPQIQGPSGGKPVQCGADRGACRRRS